MPLATAARLARHHTGTSRAAPRRRARGNIGCPSPRGSGQGTAGAGREHEGDAVLEGTAPDFQGTPARGWAEGPPQWASAPGAGGPGTQTRTAMQPQWKDLDKGPSRSIQAPCPRSRIRRDSGAAVGMVGTPGAKLPEPPEPPARLSAAPLPHRTRGPAAAAPAPPAPLFVSQSGRNRLLLSAGRAGGC